VRDISMTLHVCFLCGSVLRICCIFERRYLNRVARNPGYRIHDPIIMNLVSGILDDLIALFISPQICVRSIIGAEFVISPNFQ